MFGMTKDRLELIKKTYPSGTRIACISMEDPWSPIQSGAKGTVDFVDDIGTIHMLWDNGRTLGLVVGEDNFKIIPANERSDRFYVDFASVTWLYFLPDGRMVTNIIDKEVFVSCLAESGNTEDIFALLEAKCHHFVYEPGSEEYCSFEMLVETEESLGGKTQETIEKIKNALEKEHVAIKKEGLPF